MILLNSVFGIVVFTGLGSSSSWWCIYYMVLIGFTSLECFVMMFRDDVSN